MKTILEVLEAVDVKLDSPERWTQLAYARDVNEKRVAENHPNACCWCLVGAVISVSEDPDHTGIADAAGNLTLEFLSKQVPTIFLHQWNDHPDRTFFEVKNFITSAKEKALREQL